MPACGQNRKDGVVRKTVTVPSPKIACLRAIEEAEAEAVKVMKTFQHDNQMCPDPCAHRTVAEEMTKVLNLHGRPVKEGYKATALVSYLCIIVCSKIPNPPPPPAPALPSGFSPTPDGGSSWTGGGTPPTQPSTPEAPICGARCTCFGTACMLVPPDHDHCPNQANEGDFFESGCADHGGHCILGPDHQKGLVPTYHQCSHGHVF